MVEVPTDSGAFLRSLSRGFPFGGVMLFDGDLRYLSAGGKGFDLVGLDPEDLIGRTPVEVFSGGDGELLSKLFGDALEGRESSPRISFRGRAYECWIAPMEDGSGEVIGGLCITWDVTEEENLEMVRSAVQELPVGLTIAVGEGSDRPLVFANDAFGALTGYDRSEVLGRDCRFLQGPETDPKVVDQIREALRGNEGIQVTLLNYRKSGQEFWNRLSVYPMRSDGSEVGYFIGIQEDVTEERRLQKELELSERMRALGQVAGGVAHDLRNVLMGAGGLLDLVLEKDLPGDEIRQDLSAAREALDRGSSVTERLLAFARQEVVDGRHIELNESLRRRIRFFEHVLREDVELRFLPSDELVWVNGDEGQLDQLLLNLAKNAEEAMPDGGTLEVAVVCGEDALDPFSSRDGNPDADAWVRISLRDTGTGMTPPVLEQAFEPFFTTRKDQGGTGLGLSSVYGTVQKMGGHVTIDSTPEIGTVVHVALPRTAPPDRKVDLSDDRLNAQLLDGVRVLLVEDEKPVRDVCTRVLENAGSRVESAEDAPEALAWISKHHEDIDILVTDAVIPGGSGVAVAEALHEVRPDVPVILMSGYTDSEVDRDKLPSGFSFLAKPFELEELVRRVAVSLY